MNPVQGIARWLYPAESFAAEQQPPTDHELGSSQNSSSFACLTYVPGTDKVADPSENLSGIFQGMNHECKINVNPDTTPPDPLNCMRQRLDRDLKRALLTFNGQPYTDASDLMKTFQSKSSTAETLRLGHLTDISYIWEAPLKFLAEALKCLPTDLIGPTSGGDSKDRVSSTLDLTLNDNKADLEMKTLFHLKNLEDGSSVGCYEAVIRLECDITGSEAKANTYFSYIPAPPPSARDPDTDS